MKRMQRIIDLLEKNLENFKIEIYDNSNLHSGHHNFNGTGETHLLVSLKSKTNYKINRLQVHRKINNLIKDEYNLGLHSLEIKIN